MANHRTTAATYLLALALAGCGFSPVREPADWAQIAVAIDERGAPLAAHSLRRALARAAVASAPAQAATLRIALRDEQVRDRLLAIDSGERAAEYQLEHRVQVRASGADDDGEWRQLTATRDYSYDETNVLGKSHERSLIRAALADELAMRIIEIELYRLGRPAPPPERAPPSLPSP